jgi:hypothetical protein
MKKLSKFLIASIVIVYCCLLACNKQENLLMPVSIDINTIKSMPIESGEVFTVSPSIDFKDSYNIQTAFDNAVEAGPGSTVQLTEGVFYLNESIEVKGFDGIFKGAGKQKTIITTQDEINFDFPPGDLEGLLIFRNGNIHVSDMTIKISNPAPCTGLNWDVFQQSFPSIFNITGKSVLDPSTTEQNINSTFNNVQFIGGFGYFYGFNVYSFINIHPEGAPNYLLNGSHNFINCEFQSASICIEGVSSCNGNWTIGGSASSGNNFENANWAVQIRDCRNSYFNISHNYCTKIYWGGVSLCPWKYFIPFTSTLPFSKYLVDKNYFEVEGIGDAVVLWDYDIESGSKKMDAIVSNNRIYLNNTMYWGGGVYGLHVNDVLVTNNIFWGNGPVGIYCGIFGNQGYDQCSNWVLKGNNLERVDAYFTPILLGPGTNNFLVIGGSNKTNVLDNGTNNILTGVNNMQGEPLGPEIQDALMRKLEMMKLFKSLEWR